jgi:hypothetical protein
MAYYDSFVKVNKPASVKWKDDFQALANKEFEDSPTYQTDIEEEVEFGTLIFEPIEARLTSLIDPHSGLRIAGDFAKLIFKDGDYKPPLGTRYRFDDNIWIVYSIANQRAVTSHVYIRRCNNTLSSQDEYGNIHREPCYIDYNLNETQLSENELLDVPSGRLNVYCQLNQWTKDIDVDNRYIFGEDVYRVRYRSKYDRRNTFDNDSCKLLTFYVNQDNKATDDNFELQVANFKDYKYSIECIDSVDNVVGTTIQLYPTVLKDGEEVTEEVFYQTSNSNIVTVSKTGECTFISEGETSITIRMKNFPVCKKVIQIVIPQEETGETEETEITDTTKKAAKKKSTTQVVTKNPAVYIYPNVNKIKLNNSIEYKIIGDYDFSISVETTLPNKYYKFNYLGDNRFIIKNMKPSSTPIYVVYYSGNDRPSIIDKYISHELEFTDNYCSEQDGIVFGIYKIELGGIV